MLAQDFMFVFFFHFCKIFKFSSNFLSFLLKPVEYTSGSACGVCASEMVKRGFETSQEVLDNIKDIQIQIRKFTQISWYINGTYHPPY